MIATVRSARLLTPLLLTHVLLLTGCSANLVHHRESFSLNVPWQDYESILVDTANGNVEVVCAAGGRLDIHGVKSAGGLTLDEARSNAQLVRIGAGPSAADARTLSVRAEFPEELRRKSPGASFVIRLPAACTAEINSRNGKIEVRGLRGPSRLKTSNGRIEARDIAGALEAYTSNGGITLEGVSGAVIAVSSNGPIALRDVTGNAELRTSNGGFELDGIGGDIDAETSNGRVRITAGTAENGQVRVRTSNGPIQLCVPRALKAAVELVTSNGRIETDADGVAFSDLRVSRSRFAANMNGGGAGRVVAQTSNGSIRFECR